MSTALRAFLVVPISFILFASAGVAYAQEDTDANDACPSAPGVYVYVSGVKYLEKVDGKVNLYGRKCVDYEAGDKAAEGICTGPKTCKAKLCDGKPCALPPLKIEDVKKSVYQGTQLAPVPVQQDPLQTPGSTFDWMFDKTPLSEQKLAPSGNAIGDFLKPDAQPGFVDEVGKRFEGLRNYFFPQNKLNDVTPVDLQGGFVDPSKTVRTTIEEGGKAEVTGFGQQQTTAPLETDRFTGGEQTAPQERTEPRIEELARKVNLLTETEPLKRLAAADRELRNAREAVDASAETIYAKLEPKQTQFEQVVKSLGGRINPETGKVEDARFTTQQDVDRYNNALREYKDAVGVFNNDPEVTRSRNAEKEYLSALETAKPALEEYKQAAAEYRAEYEKQQLTQRQYIDSLETPQDIRAAELRAEAEKQQAFADAVRKTQADVTAKASWGLGFGLHCYAAIVCQTVTVNGETVPLSTYEAQTKSLIYEEEAKVAKLTRLADFFSSSDPFAEKIAQAPLDERRMGLVLKHVDDMLEARSQIVPFDPTLGPEQPTDARAQQLVTEKQATIERLISGGDLTVAERSFLYPSTMAVKAIDLDSQRQRLMDSNLANAPVVGRVVTSLYDAIRLTGDPTAQQLQQMAFMTDTQISEQKFDAWRSVGVSSALSAGEAYLFFTPGGLALTGTALKAVTPEFVANGIGQGLGAAWKGVAYVAPDAAGVLRGWAASGGIAGDFVEYSAFRTFEFKPAFASELDAFGNRAVSRYIEQEQAAFAQNVNAGKIAPDVAEVTAYRNLYSNIARSDITAGSQGGEILTALEREMTAKNISIPLGEGGTSAVATAERVVVPEQRLLTGPKTAEPAAPNLARVESPSIVPPAEPAVPAVATPRFAPTEQQMQNLTRELTVAKTPVTAAEADVVRGFSNAVETNAAAQAGVRAGELAADAPIVRAARDDLLVATRRLEDADLFTRLAPLDAEGIVPIDRIYRAGTGEVIAERVAPIASEEAYQILGQELQELQGLAGAIRPAPPAPLPPAPSLPARDIVFPTNKPIFQATPAFSPLLRPTTVTTLVLERPAFDNMLANLLNPGKLPVAPLAPELTAAEKFAIERYGSTDGAIRNLRIQGISPSTPLFRSYDKLLAEAKAGLKTEGLRISDITGAIHKGDAVVAVQKPVVFPGESPYAIVVPLAKEQDITTVLAVDNNVVKETLGGLQEQSAIRAVQTQAGSAPQIQDTVRNPPVLLDIVSTTAPAPLPEGIRQASHADVTAYSRADMWDPFLATRDEYMPVLIGTDGAYIPTSKMNTDWLPAFRRIIDTPAKYETFVNQYLGRGNTPVQMATAERTFIDTGTAGVNQSTTVVHQVSVTTLDGVKTLINRDIYGAIVDKGDALYGIPALEVKIGEVTKNRVRIASSDDFPNRSQLIPAENEALYTPILPAQKAAFLDVILEEAQKYPLEFWKNSRPFTMYYFAPTGRMTALGEAFLNGSEIWLNPYTEEVRYAFHHELTHINDAPFRNGNEWGSTIYGVAEKWAYQGERWGTYSGYRPAGFARAYGAKEATEDPTTLSEQMFGNYAALKEAAKRDPILAIKLEKMKTSYYWISDGAMNDAYWETLAPIDPSTSLHRVVVDPYQVQTAYTVANGVQKGIVALRDSLDDLQRALFGRSTELTEAPSVAKILAAEEKQGLELPTLESVRAEPRLAASMPESSAAINRVGNEAPTTLAGSVWNNLGITVPNFARAVIITGVLSNPVVGEFLNVITPAIAEPNPIASSVTGPVFTMSSPVPVAATLPEPTLPGLQKIGIKPAAVPAPTPDQSNYLVPEAVRKMVYYGVVPIGYDRAAEESIIGTSLGVLSRIQYGLVNGNHATDLAVKFGSSSDPEKQANDRGMRNRLDAWRLYLGLPQQYDTFSVSNYRPAVSVENKQYLSINNFLKNLVDSQSFAIDFDKPTFKSEADVVQYLVKKVIDNPLDRQTVVLVDWGNFVMGRYKVSVGQDAVGTYISYYDRWDLKGSLEGKDGIVGKPFEIYDRIYFNPLTFEPAYPNVAKVSSVEDSFSSSYDVSFDDLADNKPLVNALAPLDAGYVSTANVTCQGFVNCTAQWIQSIPSQLGNPFVSPAAGSPAPATAEPVNVASLSTTPGSQQVTSPTFPVSQPAISPIPGTHIALGEPQNLVISFYDKPSKDALNPTIVTAAGATLDVRNYGLLSVALNQLGGKTVPLGAVVEITDKATGKSVVAVVNNRMSNLYNNKRIDLPPPTQVALGAKSLSPVSVRVVALPDNYKYVKGRTDYVLGLSPDQASRLQVALKGGTNPVAVNTVPAPPTLVRDIEPVRPPVTVTTLEEPFTLAAYKIPPPAPSKTVVELRDRVRDIADRIETANQDLASVAQQRIPVTQQIAKIENIASGRSNLEEAKAGLTQLKKLSTPDAKGQAVLVQGVSAAGKIANIARQLGDSALATRVNRYVTAAKVLQKPENQTLALANQAILQGDALIADTEALLNRAEASIPKTQNLASLKKSVQELDAQQAALKKSVAELGATQRQVQADLVLAIKADAEAAAAARIAEATEALRVGEQVPESVFMTAEESELALQQIAQAEEVIPTAARPSLATEYLSLGKTLAQAAGNKISAAFASAPAPAEPVRVVAVTAAPYAPYTPTVVQYTLAANAPSGPLPTLQARFSNAVRKEEIPQVQSGSGGALPEANPLPEPTVYILMGGTGAGKTTVASGVLPKLNPSAAIIDDASLSAADITRIANERLGAGEIPNFVYVHRDPVETFAANRGGPIDAFAERYVESQQAVKGLLENQALQKEGLRVTLLDNSRGLGNAVPMTPEAFNAVPRPTLPELKQQLLAKTNEMFEAGTINAQEYKALTGAEAPTKVALAPVEPVAPAPELPPPAAPSVPAPTGPIEAGWLGQQVEGQVAWFKALPEKFTSAVNDNLAYIRDRIPAIPEPTYQPITPIPTSKSLVPNTAPVGPSSPVTSPLAQQTPTQYVNAQGAASPEVGKVMEFYPWKMLPAPRVRGNLNSATPPAAIELPAPAVPMPSGYDAWYKFAAEDGALTKNRISPTIAEDMLPLGVKKEVPAPADVVTPPTPAQVGEPQIEIPPAASAEPNPIVEKLTAVERTALAARLLGRGATLPMSTLGRNILTNQVTGTAGIAASILAGGPVGLAAWPALNAGTRYLFNAGYRADVRAVFTGERPVPQTPTPIPVTPTVPAAQAAVPAATQPVSGTPTLVLKVLRGTVLPGDVSFVPPFGIVRNTVLNGGSYLLAGPGAPLLNAGYRFLTSKAYRGDVLELFARIRGTTPAPVTSTSAVAPVAPTTPTTGSGGGGAGGNRGGPPDEPPAPAPQPNTGDSTAKPGWWSRNWGKATIGGVTLIFGAPVARYFLVGDSTPAGGPSPDKKKSTEKKPNGGAGETPPPNDNKTVRPPGGPVACGPNDTYASSGCYPPYGTRTTSEIPSSGDYCITSIDPIVVVPGVKPGPNCYNYSGSKNPLSTLGSVLGQLLGRLFGTTPPAPAPVQPTKPPVTPPVATSTPAKPYATLVANPTSVTAGGKSRLIWTSINTSGCELLAPDNFLMATGTRGSTSTRPLATTTPFTLTCGAPSGATTTASTTVIVR